MRRVSGLLCAAGALFFSAPGQSQVVDVDLRTQVFHEPSALSHMTVLTPQATVSATALTSLQVFAAYEADVVSGASEVVKAGPLLGDLPDIVSRASVQDFRQVATGGLGLDREHARVAVSYSYGVENDYRSNAISISAGTDLLQRNTDVEIAYSRGFDQVCTLSQRTLATTLRRGLDSSDLCFSESPEIDAVDISLDNFRLAWTQAWTPVFTSQLVLSGALQHGFLGNPYREVVIGPTGQAAQENHPSDRRRAAAALQLKYYSRLLKTAFGTGLRGYRDSWELKSMSVELSAERYLLPWLTLLVHGRAYVQSGANFWSDDYTGGEPLGGPRGQYWSGDREMSPLKNLLGGVRIGATWRGPDDARMAGVFRQITAGASLDLIKTFLDDFTWAGQVPDDTFVMLPSLNASGSF
jgi:uncharacterized protein DUF3570